MAKRAGIYGDKQVRAAFRAMMKQYGTPVNQASRFALQPILKAARANIAEDPELSKSLTIKKDRQAPKTRPTHAVGPASDSPARRRAHFKEFGTDPHMIDGHPHPGEPPRPFLTPAYEAHGKEAIKRFGEKLGPALEKQAAKLARKGNT